MNIYAKRRQQLATKMNDNSVAYIFSGSVLMYSQDEEYRFKANNNFYYLTGIRRCDMIVEISKINGIVKEALYMQSFDELLAKWIGARLSYDDARAISSIETIKDFDNFHNLFASLANQLRCLQDINIYLDLYQFKANQNISEGVKFARYLSDNYPGFKIVDSYPILTNMRLIKDATEIENIKKAIEITRLAIENMWQNASNCQYEYQLEAHYNFGMMINGCKDVAFETIMASGKNATTLHYIENDAQIDENAMALCDLGATYMGYKADISRTFPVNGKFTVRQKELYNVVLNGQQLVIDNAKVGVTLGELNSMLVNYYKEELPKHNLLKPVDEYYYHGVSHMLGLDTHDVDNMRGQTKLEKGMVITVEPGLYVADEAIGIRIEDDILIDDQPINLSASIKKIPEDIEQLIK